jgi:hypothetical protein
MWTKRVAANTGGRDPLGLSRVAFLITDFLLSGIITTTDRARYYSFYCWALWHIEREDKPKTDREFVTAFRRREAAMALATVAHNPTTSPVGVLAVAPQIEKGKAEGFFNCDFKVLPSNPLGGYGQYYAGSLYHLGLYHRPENSFDTVTEGIAEELAEAYHAAVERSPYIKKQLYRGPHIPAVDLEKSKEFLTLDALSNSFAATERARLIDIFFGFSNQHVEQASVLRRHTLTLLLHAIGEHEQQGIYPDGSKAATLDEYLLYAFYYGVLWLEEADETFPYKAPETLTFCRELWRQFCLHQFLAQAIELLLCSVLELLSVDVLGLTSDEVVGRLVEPEFTNTLEKLTGKSCARPRDLLNALGIKGVPDTATSETLQKRLLPTHSLSEAKILSLSDTDAQDMAAQGILLLAVLYGKWRGVSTDHAFAYVASHARQELWMGTVLPYLDSWADKSITWQAALQNIIEPFIFKQHDRIMYEKGKLDSCWLERREGRILKVQDYDPVWRSSRHLNAVRIMRDLGLVRFGDENELSLTAQGKKILERSLKHSHGTT